MTHNDASFSFMHRIEEIELADSGVWNGEG